MPMPSQVFTVGGPGFVIAGIGFSDNRLIGYSLMGVGVALAIVDNILVRRRP